VAKEPLDSYLNDHLAGSVAALELLDHLADAHADTSLGALFSGLHAEISGEQQELKGLMQTVGAGESGPRKAAAWIGEKVALLKMGRDDGVGGAFRLLEALDTLVAAIRGKEALWRALSAAAEDAPRLRELDYARLIRQAEDQRESLEAVRIDAARRALAAPEAR
jgi:hypothetical protein